jgi:adenylosuccinate synthase
MQTNSIIIVQGGQWGSEAKGAVAGFLCVQRKVDYAVRTGAVNAGHTVYLDDLPYVMQQLPCGFVNPATKLVIGAGALVHPGILQAEVEHLERFVDPNIRKRLYIDYRAGLHTEAHTQRSKESGRHHGIGATGKGCSEALVDRVRLRGAAGKLFRDIPEAGKYNLSDTSELLNNAYDQGAQILLEGTQGSLLDLYLGPYPYTTHKPTQAATWIQEAGLSPSLDYEIVLVVRTFPIRVAGNSGPMPNEISWSELASRLNARLKSKGLPVLIKGESLLYWEEACAEIARSGKYRVPYSGIGMARWDLHNWTPDEREECKVACSELHRDAFNLLEPSTQADLRKLFEFTTVTKKLRRVADLNLSELKRACMWNRPDYIVLTFLNYLMPEIKGCQETASIDNEEVRIIVSEIEEATGVTVVYATTGPEPQHILEVPPFTLKN